jgi:hypothetical protein
LKVQQHAKDMANKPPAVRKESDELLAQVNEADRKIKAKK